MKDIKFSKDNNVEIKYSLYRSLEREQWEIWQTITRYFQNGSGGACTRCLFSGTKKECEKKIKELKKKK